MGWLKPPTRFQFFRTWTWTVRRTLLSLFSCRGWLQIPAISSKSRSKSRPLLKTNLQRSHGYQMHPIKPVVQEMDLGTLAMDKPSFSDAFTNLHWKMDPSPFFHVDLLGDTVFITFKFHSLWSLKHAFPPGWLGHAGRHRRGHRCFVAGLWWHFGWDRAWWPPSCFQQSFPGVVVGGCPRDGKVDVLGAEVPGAYFTKIVSYCYGLPMVILSFWLSLDDARKFFWCALWGVPFGIWLGCCLSVFEAFGSSESDRDLRFMEPSLSFSMSTVDLTDLACGSRRRTLMSNGMRTCMANCWPLAVERRGWPATSRISTPMHGFLRTVLTVTLWSHIHN